MENQNQTIKYLTYCRKSTEDKKKQVLSVPSQKRELKENADKENLKILKIFGEERTAYKRGRSEFNKMMEMIESGKANGILVWKLDRLARNAFDGGRIITCMDEGLIKEIRTPFRTYVNSGNDKFIMGIEFNMAKKESDDKSENTKRGLREKVEIGEFPSTAHTGYLNIDKYGKIAGKQYDKQKQELLDDLKRPLKRIEIDPLMGELVKRAFEEVARGDKPTEQIWKDAVGWGLRTNRGGQLISRSKFYEMFTNPFYYGVMRYKNEECEGNHDHLISKELFDKVQQVLNQKSKPRKSSHEFDFTGLVICDACECAITASHKVKPSGKTYRYYHCTKRKGNCGQSPLTEKEFKEQIEERIEALSIDKDVWELCIELLKKSYEGEIELQNKMKKSWQRQLVVIEEKLKRLLDLRIQEEISKEEFIEKKNELICKKADLQEKLSDSEKNSQSWLDAGEEFFNKAYSIRESFENDSFEEKKSLVRSLGWNLRLRDKNLLWEYKKPFDVLVKGVKEDREAIQRLELAKLGSTEREMALVSARNEIWGA